MISNLFSSQNQLTSLKNIRGFIDTYAKKDNWHEIDKATGNLGYGWIHYAFIRMLRPARVLCVGSTYGFIPAICALACKDNKKGMVDFVDAGHDQANPAHNKKLGATKDLHWGGVGFWHTKEAKNQFKSFDLDRYVSIHIITSKEFAKQSGSLRWHYVSLDGDHSYEGISADFRRFWPKVLSGGLMTFHDIYTTGLGGLSYGVRRFWKDITKRKKYNTISLPGICGLGILQKT